MTIVHVVRCDAYGCHNELELEQDDYPESVMTAHGYMTDPMDGYTHYCSKCVPEVQKEIDERDAEEEE